MSEYSLTWLPDVLRAAGLKVAIAHEGWQTCGRGDVGHTYGVLCHHTATIGGRHLNMPTLRTLIEGRSNLRGPLAHLGLGRDGTYYVVAAGLCNHAGKGNWLGITEGNTHFIGIEAENTGGYDDPWPSVQLTAYHRGVAAILQYIGQSARFCAGHKEYALPKGRKADPDFDMGAFRAEVARIIDGTAPAPTLIPAAEPTAAPGQRFPRPTLYRDQRGAWVKELQTKLGVAADGVFEAGTEAALRAFQRAHGLVADGILGPATWRVLDADARLPTAVPPTWQ